MIRDCLQCLGNRDTAGCGLFFQRVNSIQAHWKEHVWSSTKGKGGSMAHKRELDPNKMWTKGHSCQRFFHFQPWSKLFRVKEAEARTAGSGVTVEKRA